MDYDTNKVDDAVLALLLLTLHDGNRAWKRHDWDVLGRLYEKGLLANPRNRNESVVITEEELRRAKEVFSALFAS